MPPTGRLAEREGVSLLANICRLIAADETRHEEVYIRFMTQIFRLDASEAVMAYSDMMRSRITMPARLMGEEAGIDLFKQFSDIAEDLGVYTSEDYISIIEHLNPRWQIANLKGLSSVAAEQQEYVCELPHRTRRAVSRLKVRQISQASQAFDSVFP
jgi:acyl-[acyl-carrier-protein] desaturase